MSDFAWGADIAALAIRADALEAHIDSVTDLFFGHARETGATDYKRRLIAYVNTWRQSVIRISTVEIAAVACDEAEVEHRAIE